MTPCDACRWAADAVLVAHFAVVVFVVGGLAFVVVGATRGWPSARSRGFRGAHLAAIAFVVAQSWLGASCPLTVLEARLRDAAGGGAYRAGFVEHWLQRLLYWEAEPWVFTVAYSLFGLAVVAAWLRFPPERGGGARRRDR